MTPTATPETRTLTAHLLGVFACPPTVGDLTTEQTLACLRETVKCMGRHAKRGDWQAAENCAALAQELGRCLRDDFGELAEVNVGAVA
jgi:hypothetical protein